jgi:fatty acid desaturase
MRIVSIKQSNPLLLYNYTLEYVRTKTHYYAILCNAQVTHHLYPGVSQYHYPAIAPIIKQTCKEYGIEYKCLPTFAAAFHAHIKHLKNMGERGVPAELHMG